MSDPFEIVLRTATVLAALLLAALLFTSKRDHAVAVPGSVFCLAVAAFFITSTPGSGETLGILRYPLTGLCVSKPVWFWLFSRALFVDNSQLRSRHLMCVVGVAVVGIWQQTVFLVQHAAGQATPLAVAAGFGFEAALLVFVVLGVYLAWRDLRMDLVEGRRRLRLTFMLTTSLYLVTALFVQGFNLVLDTSTPSLLVHANLLAVASICVVAAWFLVRPRQTTWLDPTPPVPASTLSPNDTRVLRRLEDALTSDRIHLQEGLTISGLSQHLGAGEHVLRRVINKGLGFRNFNDFLHAWRIQEACEELACPGKARESVLSIAMRVGYGSIGAFNRAFKSRIGMTPTHYRRNRLEDARPTR